MRHLRSPHRLMHCSLFAVAGFLVLVSRQTVRLLQVPRSSVSEALSGCVGNLTARRFRPCLVGILLEALEGVCNM